MSLPPRSFYAAYQIIFIVSSNGLNKAEEASGPMRNFLSQTREEKMEGSENWVDLI